MTEQTIQSGIAGIRFQKLGKLYHFDSSKVSDLRLGDQVIVTTSRGREMGEVVSLGISASEAPAKKKIKPIDRKATPQELVLRNQWKRKELEAMIDCRAKAAELNMRGLKVAKAEYSFDGSRLTFLYNTDADEKINVHRLHQAMQKQLKGTQVRMHQIGPRDVAKIIGGLGACGLEERCCSKFLTEFSPISIRMAKAQGISLNPNEITGMCGRLRCCLMYEYEQYVAAKKELPKRKKRVVTPLGEGRVVDVLPLKQAVVVKLDDGKKAEFLKHELQPYDELKALEEKANSPCDRHENGGCDCGKAEKESK
ncbi:MAG: regulatory iron-sulfur-containing complex subunit RicT [Anaerolineales bacterium]